MFKSALQIADETWQAFERDISRLLICQGFENVRLVGQTGDHGADVTGNNYGRKWLFQAKKWGRPVGLKVIDETLAAAREYQAQNAVVVASDGFDGPASARLKQLMQHGVPLQLWGPDELVAMAKNLNDVCPNKRKPRQYQEDAINEIVTAFYEEGTNNALVVMATGLGKTFVAGEALRRIRAVNPGLRVLVCAHTNDLVYQLEKAFWQFLRPSETTVIWNTYEKPNLSQLGNADFVFACVDSVANFISLGKELPPFDILLVDECHHVGSETYETVFDDLRAGQDGGTFALGLTATPWRADGVDPERYFGPMRVNIDTVTGLKSGFLANVDYRMFTSNINWDSLHDLQGHSFSPRQINRTLFIDEWDDAVVNNFQKAWKEQYKPRAIVFCGTIEHALTMKRKINQLGICRAEAIYSGTSGFGEEPMTQYRRNRILGDFDDGKIGAICAVDIFNEGIDVPDVNLIVFQRVTHSRRIFIQQLGRGLRIAEDKDKVIVLDFVSDIRRFAAGIELKDGLVEGTSSVRRVSIHSKVSFMKATGDDPEAEVFLREWLKDVIAIEESDEDASVLQFPPELRGEC